MSTRRARIKAVATLPQRRKNANNVETKKAQDVTVKEITNANDVSRPSVEEVRTSPARLNFSSPRRSPRVVSRTPEPDRSLSNQKISTPVANATEKQTVSRSDVFLSPRIPSSPKLRSPISKTPVVEVDVGGEKLLTPHKRLLELQAKANKLEKLPNKDNVESPKRDKMIVTSKESLDLKNLEGYNSPNTPEPDVMDGIVPLKKVNNVPKPIDLLKSEIISENAEVAFDPIVPLPSPTKMRSKLRPVPRLGPIGPIRRNSIPGSASESEDESRRGQHGPSTPVPPRLRHDSQSSHSTLHSLPNRDVARVRNDSQCSMMSQGAPQTPAHLSSPMKEKTVFKTRRQETIRRMAAIRRRKESIQREKLTMYDLIFYNPLSNPIVRDKEKEEEIQSRRKEEEEDTVKAENSAPSNNNSAPVPQIKLGPNGEIVLDEQSLVIKQSERELSKSVVMDSALSATARVYRRTPRTADWTDAETVRFYRALAALGTDFSLMQGLFPARTRRDLKFKFKKEEKTNMAQIDKALRSISGWDMNRLLDEFTEERRMEEEQALNEKKRIQREKEVEEEKARTIKELKVKQSKGSRALGVSNLPDRISSTSRCVTADDVIELALHRKSMKRKTRGTSLTQAKPDKVGIPRLPFGSPATKVAIPATKVGVPATKVPMQYAVTPTKGDTPGASTPRVPPIAQSPVVINPLPAVPANIAPGSLVVLTVDDPVAPTKKAIHTYIKQSDGSIASVVLNSSVMSSLVTLVKKDSQGASPGASTSGRNGTPPYPSPNKRKRLASGDVIEL